jgi:hypothetical protein
VAEPAKERVGRTSAKAIIANVGISFRNSMVTSCFKIGLIKKTDYEESMGLQVETNARPTAVMGQVVSKKHFQWVLSN